MYICIPYTPVNCDLQGYQVNPPTLKKKQKLGFTPCKAEQPLQGMELHEKEAQKD